MDKQDTGWYRFDYNGKPRMGLVIGPDTRPGTNNAVILTEEGVRMYKYSKMENIINETTVIA